MLRRYVWLVPTDTEGGSQMSQDEAAGRAAQQFSSLDKNGDNKLSQDEWQSSSAPAASGSGQGQTEQKYGALDADDSGSVSMEEYRQNRQQAFDEAMRNQQGGSHSQSGGQSSGQQQAGSTQQSGSGQSGSGEAADGQSEGVPVFIYRLYTL